MMHVSLGHRFFAIEANLPSPPKWEWEPTSTTVDRAGRSSGTNLDFVRRGPLRPSGPGLGRPPDPVRTGSEV